MEPSSSSPTASLQSLTPSINEQQKSEKFKIILDSSTNTYYSGQTIRGTISLCSKQPKKIRGIYFRIIGYGKCKWTDILRRETITTEVKSERSTRICSGNEEYLYSVVYVIGSKNSQSFTLSEGTSTYDFSFNLKSRLPSSFHGSYGKIKYKMEFIVDRPWKFDEKQQIVLNIIQLVDLNTLRTINERPLEQQFTRNIGYISSGPVSLHVFIPKSAYVAGDKLPIQVIVSNNSRIHIDKIKFSMIKIIEYHSNVPVMAMKREIQKILRKEAGGVNKKTEQRYEHVVDVPITTPTQNFEVSQLIQIKYEIKVEAKIGGLHKNLIVTIPFKIGNVPINGTQPMPIPSILLPYPNNSPSQSNHMPSIGFNFNRLSMTSNSSFRLIGSSTASLTNSDSIQSNRISSNQITDAESIVSASLHSSTSSLNYVGESLTSNQTSSVSSSAVPEEILARNTSTFQPSAPPPPELNSTLNISYISTTSSTFMDAPPSYDEVFGTATTSRTEIHTSSFSASARKS